MQPASKTEWWRRRRLLFPTAGFAFLNLALLVAIARSNTSTVIVCNRTGALIHDLEISACGQSRRFESISDRESIQLELTSPGTGTEIILTVGDAVMWRGEYLEASGGYHASLHLQRDGHIDASITRSAWQRLLQSIFNTSL